MSKLLLPSVYWLNFVTACCHFIYLSIRNTTKTYFVVSSCWILIFPLIDLVNAVWLFYFISPYGFSQRKGEKVQLWNFKLVLVFCFWQLFFPNCFSHSFKANDFGYSFLLAHFTNTRSLYINSFLWMQMQKDRAGNQL